MKNVLIAIMLASFLTGCGGGGASGGNDSTSGGAEGGIGKGGSMARFAISGDYLYTLNKRDLEVFDISIPSRPLPYTKDRVPFDVETLFSYKEHLYVGAESGVYIYSKPTADKNMERIGQFTHMKSCDPVVVEDDVAYVTLRSGSTCRLQSGENSLQVLDVRNPVKPKLITTKNMIEPKGLGIDNGTLFVCDGVGGLKVFHTEKGENNETNETTVAITFDRNSSLSQINCYDVIPYNKNLIISNGDDVRQFDYSHFPMQELGRIK
jgi:hypothetical protein